MKINCLVVDDEPFARKLVTEFISETDFLDCKAVAENPVRAAALLSEQSFDLIFLDINMPKISGIEFIKNNLVKPMVIITTAYSEYALEGFNCSVIDYLLKPFSYERFFKAAMKAKEMYELKLLQQDVLKKAPNDPEHFYVKVDGRFEKIHYDQLLYIEANLNYVVIHTQDKKYLVYLTLKSLMGHLPADQFIKIHKSTVINLKKITSIEGNVVNVSGKVVTISHSMQEQVLKTILHEKLIKR